MFYNMDIYCNKRRKKIKQELVNHKGGSCQICGYDKCLSAMEFHHIDPTEKDFNLSTKSRRSGMNKLDDLKKEADKCLLVCSNCHREIHEGLHDEWLKTINLN